MWRRDDVGSKRRANLYMRRRRSGEEPPVGSSRLLFDVYHLVSSSDNIRFCGATDVPKIGSLELEEYTNYRTSEWADRWFDWENLSGSVRSMMWATSF